MADVRSGAGVLGQEGQERRWNGHVGDAAGGEEELGLENGLCWDQVVLALNGADCAAEERAGDAVVLHLLAFWRTM